MSDQKLPTAKPSIYDIAPYVGGRSKSEGVNRTIKLSSNEGAFGPPPMAVEAMKEAAENAHFYPDGGCDLLTQALAKKNNIDAREIVCGAGSDEIISLICQSYAGQGDEVLYSEHGFLMYEISAKAAGATPVSAPEKDLKADPAALLAAVTDKTKIVFLANPNNPTGSYLTRDEIVDFHAQLPSNVLLVLDAAYAEYVEDTDYAIGHDLVKAHKNIIVTRTFSKIYALGGLRLGWGHCDYAVADVLHRVRGPFNVNSIAQAAGVAALEDDDFIQKSINHNRQCRDHVTEALTDMGLIVHPSAGNFLLVDFGGTQRATGACMFLYKQGILVRQVGGYGLPSCLRISIGTDEEMGLAISAIRDYLKS